MLSGKIVLDDNPIMRYCIRNVELARDHCDNVKPKKTSERMKIDGVISCLQALAAYQDACGSNQGTNIPLLISIADLIMLFIVTFS